jgi:hypothetical protein
MVTVELQSQGIQFVGLSPDCVSIFNQLLLLRVSKFMDLFYVILVIFQHL